MIFISHLICNPCIANWILHVAHPLTSNRNSATCFELCLMHVEFLAKLYHKLVLFNLFQYFITLHSLHLAPPWPSLLPNTTPFKFLPFKPTIAPDPSLEFQSSLFPKSLNAQWKPYNRGQGKRHFIFGLADVILKKLVANCLKIGLLRIRTWV